MVVAASQLVQQRILVFFRLGLSFVMPLLAVQVLFRQITSSAVARKVWEDAKKLRVEGNQADEHYVDLIATGEKCDQDARVDNNGVS